jgi:glycosyltransferase involved in cell wall biosynthesis
VDLSVVLSTYNRGAQLSNALEKLLQQETNGIEYEIIIVDNNCTDHTKELVQSYIARDRHFRYVFERRQGLSYGRNAGIEAARADLIVFCDDDVEVSPSWVQKNYEAGVKFPDADYIGGKVMPIWSGPVPRWVRNTMAPFALSMLGDEPLVASPEKPHCLVGASLAIRRRAFEKAGLFSIETQRVKDSIGSTEDYDWQLKVWAYGGHGVYDPAIVCATEIPMDRLRKSYHRRWHLGHGKFNAISGRPPWDSPRRFLGVPVFMYRQFLEAIGGWLMYLLRGKEADAFERQMQVMFYIGFFKQRWKTWFAGAPTRSPATQP